MVRKKQDIESLYFGVVLMDFNTKQPKAYNLFNNLRVLRSIAIYRAHGIQATDPLHFCFGDVSGRVEYEFVIAPWGGVDGDAKIFEVGHKIDIYQMFVEPNRDYLMSLVDSVSVSSAKRWLKENP